MSGTVSSVPQVLTSLCSHPYTIPSPWVSAGVASNQQSAVKLPQCMWLQAPNDVVVQYATTALIWILSASLCLLNSYKEISNHTGELHMTRKCGWLLWVESRFRPMGKKEKQNKTPGQTKAISSSTTRNWILSTTPRAPQLSSRQETQLWLTTG